MNGQINGFNAKTKIVLQLFKSSALNAVISDNVSVHQSRHKAR